MAHPKPEPEFGFWFHSPNWWGKRVGQIVQRFPRFQWTKSMWSRNEKLIDIGARAKSFRRLKLEPDPVSEI